MNTVNILGRIVREPDLSYTSQGMAIATITVAVNRSFKNQAGETEADFIRVKAFKKTAELIASMTKGEQIGITGSWQTGSFDGNDGKKVYTNECIVNQITFISQGGKPNEEKPKQKPKYDNFKNEDPFARNSKPIEITEDSLPF